MTPTIRHRALSAAALLAAVVVLGGVFALYTRADFMVRMIDQVWACF